jgi:hypothetical protein
MDGTREIRGGMEGIDSIIESGRRRGRRRCHGGCLLAEQRELPGQPVDLSSGGDLARPDREHARGMKR